MRTTILVLLFATFMMPAVADFESQEEVSKWLTFYYQTPSPDRLPAAVEYMSRSGMLDKKNTMAPIFGFISGVFDDNPTKVDGWIDRLSSLKEEHLGVVILGLWYANLQESQRLTYRILDKHPKLNNQFAFLRKGSPIPIDKIPLENGPWVLDALWGNFMATGRKKPIERIMEALPWVDIKGDIQRLLIGGAAQWSLTSNAIQHDLVFKFCEAAIKTKPKDIALKLQKILEVARKERQQRQNESLPPTSALTRLLG